MIVLDVIVLSYSSYYPNQIKSIEILLMLRTILSNDGYISSLFNVGEQKKRNEKQRRPSVASHFDNRTLSKESRLSSLGQLHHCFLSEPFAYTSGVSFFFLPCLYIIKEVYSDE